MALERALYKRIHLYLFIFFWKKIKAVFRRVHFLFLATRHCSIYFIIIQLNLAFFPRKNLEASKQLIKKILKFKYEIREFTQ